MKRRAVAASTGSAVLVLAGASLDVAARAPRGPLAATGADAISVSGFEAPETINREEPYEVVVDLASDASNDVTVTVAYVFEDEPLNSKEVTVPANDSTQVTFTIEGARVTELVETFGAGTHIHSITIDGSTAAEREVTIPESATGTPTPTSTGSASELETALDQAAAALEEADAALKQAAGAIDDAEASGATVEDLRGTLAELRDGYDSATSNYQAAKDAGDSGNTDRAIELANEATSTANTVQERAAELQSTAEARTAAGATDTATPNRAEQRGFFSNGGNEPDALSNVVNLTVIGFMLSVGQILHQMLEGD